MLFVQVNTMIGMHSTIVYFKIWVSRGWKYLSLELEYGLHPSKQT